MNISILTQVDAESLRATVFHGLIAPPECGALIEIARACEAKASVCDSDTGVVRVDAVRNNNMSWVDNDHPLVRSLNQRIAALTGIPLENQEPLQVLHYRPGEEYVSHHDAFTPGNQQLEHGGNRVATVLLYLNSVPAGGGTFFPEIDMRVFPHMGLGLFFRSVKDGQIIQRSLHAGEPILRGEKWIASKWIRERAYV
jgi:prolyl 4-hydroxylase